MSAKTVVEVDIGDQRECLIPRLIAASAEAASAVGHGYTYDLAAAFLQFFNLFDGGGCASRVSVLVMDCTLMGAPPPTVTLPTLYGFRNPSWDTFPLASADYAGDILVGHLPRARQYEQYEPDEMHLALGLRAIRACRACIHSRKTKAIRPPSSAGNGSRFMIATLRLRNPANSSSGLIPACATSPVSWAIPTGPVSCMELVPTKRLRMEFLIQHHGLEGFAESQGNTAEEVFALLWDTVTSFSTCDGYTRPRPVPSGGFQRGTTVLTLSSACSAGVCTQHAWSVYPGSFLCSARGPPDWSTVLTVD